MALAACSPETPGTASPVSTPRTAETSALDDQVPGPGVPKVERPLDVAKFASAPCSALTDSQVSEVFGQVIAAKPDPRAPAGPTCSWDPADGSGASVNLIFSTAGDNLGLTGVYRARETSYKLFEPLPPISGYPAVIYGTSDFRAKGNCSLAVGTSDRSTVDLTITQSHTKVGNADPCQAAQAVAAKVISSLKGGN
ncbi:DUF3558 domain-containing protein [Amycolatopsis sp. NPDC004625]|uniref:DUF3558 domain-containing protein n=1 Tax=Amycolatopsis sp. NPDC004625 TaxID=3154670 RepID=UPI0033ABF4FF